MDIYYCFMQIIVGLGNPGKKYKLTRHNIGFMAVDALAERLGLTWQNNKKFLAEIAKDNDIILVKPLTFMNNSGQAVQGILSFYKLLPKKFGLLTAKDADLSSVLTVIHDDLDIDLGKYKISLDSRSAGHKGVESIIDRLKTKKFTRVRIGIKTNNLEKIPPEKFVLQNFANQEKEIIDQLILKIIEKIKKGDLL